MDTLIANLLADALRSARASAVASTLGQEAQIGASLADVLRRMPTAIKILNAAVEWRSRQWLVDKVGIDSSNISKMLNPLVTSGWLDEGGQGEHSYRRSLVVDVLLRGQSLCSWAKARSTQGGKRG